MGFPVAHTVKNLTEVGDRGLIPGSGKSPGERNGNPLQYSCLGNPTDRGAWWATAHGIAKSRACLTSEMYLDFIINLPEFKSLLEMLINI